jgi:drug/metabolite transporter (DMT)-like permease
MKGIILVVISAFMHSLWNLLLKKSSDKHKFNYQMHLLNLAIITIIFTVFFRKYLYFDVKSVIFGFLAGLFFSFYHYFLSLSYKTEDVSKVYPITTSSPIFVTILAMILLGEKITMLGFLGILTVILGILIINAVTIKNFTFTRGVVYAIAAAITYSFGAIVEKTGVGRSNIFLYIYFLTFFMTFFLFIYSRKSTTAGHLKFFKENFSYLLAASVVLFLSVVTYRFGLETLNVSYASSIRQVNAVFGVIMGIVLLKEKDILRRLVGSIIIIIGIFFIKLGI